METNINYVMSKPLMSRKQQLYSVDTSSQENLAVTSFVSLQERFLTAVVH